MSMEYHRRFEERYLRGWGCFLRNFTYHHSILPHESIKMVDLEKQNHNIILTPPLQFLSQPQINPWKTEIIEPVIWNFSWSKLIPMSRYNLKYAFYDFTWSVAVTKIIRQVLSRYPACTMICQKSSNTIINPIIIDNIEFFRKGCCKTSDCSDYRGEWSLTKSGLTCQPWALDKPHRISSKYRYIWASLSAYQRTRQNYAL